MTDVFEMFGTFFDKAERIAYIRGKDDEAVNGLMDSLWDSKSAAADAISWLKPETKKEQKTYWHVLMFHQESGNDDAVRRMYLELSNIKPVSEDDWFCYLETFAFFSKVRDSGLEDDEFEVVDAVVDRMRELIMGRLAAAPPAEQAAAA